MVSMRIAVILTCLLVLAGCAQSNNQDPENAQSYRTGSQGLVMEFVDGFPPPKIFDDEFEEGKADYEIALEVSNKGAFEVQDSHVEFYLSGYDNKIIKSIVGKRLQPTDGERPDEPEAVYTLLPKQVLEGKSFANPDGGFETIEFIDGHIQDLNEYNIEKYNPTLLVTACYRYQTIASVNVCVDPKPFTTAEQNRICTPGSVSLGDQGAPIAVTSIDTEARPGRTRFTITIQNVGGGDVFFQENTIEDRDRCDPGHESGLGFNDLNKVSPVITVGTTTIEGRNCRPLNDEEQLRLSGGVATLVCEFDTSDVGNTPFEAPMTVKLDYNYRTTASKRVEILQGFN